MSGIYKALQTLQAGGMAPHLRAPVILAEDLGAFLSPYVMTHSHPSDFSSTAPDALFLASRAGTRHTRVEHTCIRADETHIHIVMTRLSCRLNHVQNR